jgi:TetR/AcrR family transcriptional regulator
MDTIGSVVEAHPRTQKRDRDVTLPAILAAAEIEFATNGFAAARTESIAARANVVKGMIFHYFKCKEGLYEAVLVHAYQPFSEALDKSFDRNLNATDALLGFVERLLAAMTEHPLSPVIFMLESIQGGGEHFRKLGMPSLYSRAEALLKKGIASGEFREVDPGHGAINIIGLCGFYFCAANNLSHVPGRNRNPLSSQSLARHTAEVMAFVRKVIVSSR